MDLSTNSNILLETELSETDRFCRIIHFCCLSASELELSSTSDKARTIDTSGEETDWVGLYLLTGVLVAGVFSIESFILTKVGKLLSKKILSKFSSLDPYNTWLFIFRNKNTI